MLMWNIPDHISIVNRVPWSHESCGARISYIENYTLQIYDSVARPKSDTSRSILYNINKYSYNRFPWSGGNCGARISNIKIYTLQIHNNVARPKSDTSRSIPYTNDQYMIEVAGPPKYLNTLFNFSLDIIVSLLMDMNILVLIRIIRNQIKKLWQF